MNMLETFSMEGVPYEIESIRTEDGFRAACACPNCLWGLATEGHTSQRDAMDAMTAAMRRHHTHRHAHALA
jgi:hypothetical protein